MPHAGSKRMAVRRIRSTRRSLNLSYFILTFDVIVYSYRPHHYIFLLILVLPLLQAS